MEGQYQVVSPEWDEVSNEAKDLVREGQGAGLHAKACWEVWLVHPDHQSPVVDSKAVGGGSHEVADSRGGHVSALALLCKGGLQIHRTADHRFSMLLLLLLLLQPVQHMISPNRRLRVSSVLIM